MTGYPIEGTIKVESETVTGWNLNGEPLEWLSEHESGDISKHIKNELRVEHGVGVVADFIVYESGRYDIMDVRELEEAEA